MEQNKNPHGGYEVDSQFIGSQILFIRNWGPWNTQTALDASNEIMEHLEILKAKPWALVEDLRHWELCTPDVMQVFVRDVKVLLTNNLKVRAVIPNMAIHREMIRQSMEHKQPIITDYFKSPDQALAWCRQKLAEFE
ncbi:Tim44 domain-containing protein [Dongshaea marina]|uniref:hypothetical protein n=1 Tax=Dongshaea marina TaxID=2047966 RepID=UPI000D3E6DB2|nr:hypothetical protein [Dongshaea marina]